jgi:hypothetical protein
MPMTNIFVASQLGIASADGVLMAADSQCHLHDSRACAGLAKSVITAHSVLLCGLLAPLGFLSHIVTCFLHRRLVGSPPDRDPKVVSVAFAADVPALGEQATSGRQVPATRPASASSSGRQSASEEPSSSVSSAAHTDAGEARVDITVHSDAAHNNGASLAKQEAQKANGA